MATRTLEVQITGDPSKFNRSLGHVDTSVDHTTGKFKRLGSVGKAAFSGLGLAAGAAAAVGLKKAADAAIEAEKTQARLEAQLKASGIAYDKHADHIDNVIGKVSRLSGLDDEDLTDSFTNIVRVTGDVNKSLKLTGLAADFARAKHMDVAKAGELVGKVAGGNTGILSRYGIKVKEGATAHEALAKLQEKFSGQAKAYGDTTQGAMDKAGVAWENLLEIVGEKVAPAIRKVADFFTGLFDKQSKGNKIIRTLGGAYLDWVRTVWDAIKKVAGVVGDWVDENRAQINDVIRAFKRVANAVKDYVTDVIIPYIKKIPKAVENWVDKNREQINDVIRAFKRVGNFIKDVVLDVIFPAVKWLTTKVAPIVKDFVETVLRQIGNLVKLVSDIINGDWDEAWDDFKNIVKDLIKDIPRIMGRLLTVFGEGFKKLTKKINQAGEDLGNALIEGMKKGIKEKGDDLAKTILDNIPTTDNLVDLGSKIGKKITGDGVGWTPIPTTGGVGPSSLDGADAALGPFASIAAKFGLSVTSGFRANSITSSGNLSLHSTGDAIDVSNGYATSQELAFFNFMKKNYGSQLAELIHTPGGVGIKNGQPYTYTGKVAAEHFDHVHVGYTGGIGDGIGHTSGMSGKGARKPRTGDGVGAIKGINFSPAQIEFAVAAAGASELDPRVIAAWMNREFNGYRKTDTRGKYNFMSVGYTDSGDYGWLGNAVNDPTTAGRATGLWLTGKLKGAPQAAAGIQAIADTAGGSIRSQVQAIISSPWASGHYYNDVSGFSASARAISGFGKVDGGSSGAGGGGGGTAKKNPARAKWEAAQKKVKGQAGDAVDAARNEALTGGGALELGIARAQTLQARATSKDDLAGLIKGLKQERDVKRRRLRRVRKLLKRKHRLGRKNRIALLNEEASLLADIGDLTETIKEYKADQKGGATTVSRAEELDAGVDPNAPDAADAASGASDTGAAAAPEPDPNIALLVELTREKNDRDKRLEALMRAQGPALEKALLGIVNAGIGGPVGLGYQSPGYAGGVAKY